MNLYLNQFPWTTTVAVAQAIGRINDHHYKILMQRWAGAICITMQLLYNEVRDIKYDY